MRESFLHFLWRYRKFDAQQLVSTDNQAIEIIEIGEHNTHAGPDFFNAKVKIDDILWVGNIEMHLRASEWIQHKHQEDAAYDNVILHVVMEADVIIKRSNGEAIPCLVLKPYIKENLLGTYQQILHNQYWIPCQHHFYQVSDMTKSTWWTRLLIERLQEKTAIINTQLTENQNNWEEIFYHAIAKNLGVKVNEQPFEMLARSLPLTIIGKHKNNLFQVEALVFGQAGLLENRTFEDDYPRQLQKEYQYLRQKFGLTPLDASIWKFLRLRPANFPTIRLAQLARLLFQSVHLFSKIMNTKNIKELYGLFDIELTDYWASHYVFDKISKESKKHLGKSTINLLIINTIAPFLFLYGKQRQESEYQDRALAFLEQLAPESNNIIDGWAALGVSSDSAAITQALLQQKKHYCDKQRCLDCAIGVAVLR